MNRDIGLSAGFLAVIVFFIRSLVPGVQVSNPSTAPAAELKSNGATPKTAPTVRVNVTRPPPNADALEGPWLATRHFYGPTSEPVLPTGFAAVDDLSVVDAVQDCGGDPDCQRQLTAFFGIKDHGKVNFLLATVPDPLHSRLSLFTDSSIQAIEKAATYAGWEFATQWMPWNDQVDPEEKDPKVRREQREDIRKQEKQPGVMVFRGPAAGVLIVFLAGETPTAGINSAQFQLAQAYMDAIQRPNEVRIQGPTFSGSFASLSGLVEGDEALNPGRRYRIRSGTATDHRAGQEFQRKFQGIVDFRSATANDGDQTKYFLDALDDMRIRRRRAALLIEDESGYGGGVQVAFQKVPDIKVFRFPRDISHLRNAYREAVQSSKSEHTPAPDLDFSLKDPTTGEDSIPIYSGAQSPLSQNGVINEITSAIRRDGIQIVQVTATNVFDLLFLAEVLKQRCPDTRLMVSSPDVLFTQAAQSGKLAGTLALSSYAMFDAGNQWMGRMQLQYPQFFPDASSEGVYNATLQLLSDYTHLSDYSWRKLHHPPTWILMLDRQGFLPVNVLPHPEAEEDKETWFQKVPAAGANNPPPQLPPPSGLWNLVSTSLALAGVLVSVWIFAVTFSQTLQVDARLALNEIGPESSSRLFFLFLFLILLVSILIVIWSPFWNAHKGVSLRLQGFAGLTAGIPLVCMALFLLWNGVRRKRRGLAMLCGLLLLGGALYLWLISCSSNSDRGLFFALRALELRLGSSPAWPILSALCALLAWSFLHLTRFFLVECQKPVVLTRGIKTPLQPRLNEAFDSFNASLASFTGLWTGKQQRFWSVVIVELGGLLCWLARIDVKLRSIEGLRYDLLAIGLQLLVLFTLLGACWQIMYLWRSFQSFLSCLGIMPLATSFIRTDRSASNRPIWVRRLNLQSIDIHARSMVTLHDMQLLSEPGGMLDGWMENYRNLLTHGLLQVDPPQTRARALKAARDLRELHEHIASGMFEVARDQWSSEPLSARIFEPQSSDSAAPGDATAARPAEQSGNKKRSDYEKFGDLAQTFLALHYSAFILYGIRQIQYLVMFLSVGFVLLMFSMSSYSFQAPQFTGRLLLALFAVMTWVVWTCLSGMERDPIVSRIAGTDPGKLNRNFYFKLLSYGSLPLLGLLASQFPSIANFLLSAVEPTLEAFR